MSKRRRRADSRTSRSRGQGKGTGCRCSHGQPANLAPHERCEAIERRGAGEATLSDFVLRHNVSHTMIGRPAPTIGDLDPRRSQLGPEDPGWGRRWGRDR